MKRTNRVQRLRVEAPARGERPTYWSRSYGMLRDYIGLLKPRLRGLEDTLPPSGLLVSLDSFIAGMLLSTIIGGLVGLGLGLGLALALPFPTLARLLLPFGTTLLGGALGMAATYLYPTILAQGRRRRLDEEMPHIMGQMAVLAAAGVTPENIFRTIAAENTRDIIVREARMIQRDIDLLGMDLAEALEHARRRSPSPAWSEFLDGFIANARAGADLKEYLLRQAATVMTERRMRAKELGETIGVIAEMYTIMLVVFPLLIIIMFSIMALIVGTFGGISILLLMQVVTYLLVPLLGAMVLVIADAAMPKR
jgi:flagellar protein FlaJ